MNKKIINKAIQYLDLEIQGNRQDGYYYFTDRKNGEQIGESVMVCYLNQLTLTDWIKEAMVARDYHSR
jgi:hypothetical protein